MEHASEGLVEKCPQIKGSIPEHILIVLLHTCIVGVCILYICIIFFYLEYKHDVMTYF